MEFAVHLPLIAFDDRPFTLGRLLEATRTARDAGYAAIAANDHIVFPRPWLDGPTALAAVLPETGDMDLFTTVALPVVRGPAAMAKTLAALDILSGGRMNAGLGPGSSARDYEVVSLDFDERWKRLDEAIDAIRTFLAGNSQREGAYYDFSDVRLEPQPGRDVPIWIGSWGSDAGLRRVARKADGWLASAYNTTPEQFHLASERLASFLRDAGRDPSSFPNGLSTMFLFLVDSDAEAERVLTERLAPAIPRPLDQLRERLLVCSPGEAVDRLLRYRSEGLQRVFLWPIADEPAQLERFANDVMPAVQTMAS